MSRTIKFRVWDTDNKQWVSYSKYQCIPSDFIRSQDESPIFELKGRDDEARFIIELFTGLLDKHGKEIYEGDFVNFNTQDCTYIGEVEFFEKAEVWFDNESACWMFGRFENQIHTIDKGNISFEYGYSIAGDGISEKSMEVVGNIHEIKQND